MKKWIVLVVVLGGAWFGYTQWRAWPGRVDANAASRPTTAPVITTNINFAVNAAGEIGPAEQVSVRPEINGKIEVLRVDLGDRVKRGDLLFQLDDKELRQEYASSKTAIERAQLELAKAERDFRRAEDLRREKLISEELYENTRTIFELARNAVDRSQKDLAILEERLTKTKVLAPFDCTILTRPVSVGQAVSGSGGFNSGTEVLTIADLTSMIIIAHVNQADVPRLTASQEVEVTVEAVAGLKVTGTVERIAPQATIKNNIKGFAARILLKNVDQRIRPGMTANIKIPVASASNVMAIPLAAVFTERNPENGQQERYVYVQRGEGFERRSVEVGVSDFFYAEIQSGLQSGDIVAVEPPKESRDKQNKNLAGSRPGGSEASATKVASGPGAKPAGSTNAVPAVPVGGGRPVSGPVTR